MSNMEAFNKIMAEVGKQLTEETITAIKAALEAKDEPVALVVYRGEICYKSTDDDQSFGIWCPVNYDSKHEFADGTKFYTSPPQRNPLSDDEIVLIIADCAASHQHLDIHLARAIEAAHGIKE